MKEIAQGHILQYHWSQGSNEGLFDSCILCSPLLIGPLSMGATRQYILQVLLNVGASWVFQAGPL